MLFLHALLAFLFCASAVALPGLPLHSSGVPDIPANIPKKAKGRYCRFAAPNRTPVLKEHINDIMILRDEDEMANGNKHSDFGMVELWQLSDTPGVLTGGQVLRTTTELSRLKGDWIRFPTGIHDKDNSEMVHVDVGPGLVVTCGRLIGEGLWNEISLVTAATGYYYNVKALTEPLHPHDPKDILDLVLLLERPAPRFIPQFRLLKRTGDHLRGAPLERYQNVGMNDVKYDMWIPFPVAINDVRKVEIRNQVFCFMENQRGQKVVRFRTLKLDLGGEIGH
ncbi:hypothetical protein F5887DRAFT_972517 [Amanita rubescens]|nr:hypothetical protein F5887DRAFT_972517 [Amanita rubescens]